ncbi:MAG: serine/threonine protein kinase, partial [Myxococcales bacterium]
MSEGLTRELISTEALSILKSLRDNSRAGRSNKLADVKSTFENSVSIEFDNYFFFLRKYHFIAMDREACLQLTGEGEKVLEAERRERFDDVVQEYFGSRITLDEVPRADPAGTVVAALPVEEKPSDVADEDVVAEAEPARPAVPPPPPSGAQLPS